MTDETTPDAAQLIVAALERRVFDDCLAAGRLDILDAIRATGYEVIEVDAATIGMVVKGEVVGTVRITPPGSARAN